MRRGHTTRRRRPPRHDSFVIDAAVGRTLHNPSTIAAHTSDIGPAPPAQEDHKMDRRFGWAVMFGAIAIAAIVGVASYNAGVSHGLAVSAQASGTPGAIPPYYWYRPWGFGFGFFPFALLFWFLLFRFAFWGGYRRRWHYDGWREVPPSFEEWHRRAHEKMTAPPTA